VPTVLAPCRRPRPPRPRRLAVGPGCRPGRRGARGPDRGVPPGAPLRRAGPLAQRPAPPPRRRCRPVFNPQQGV